MEKERDGFPLTSIREINILLSFGHKNVVDVSEVVVGDSLDQVFMVMEFMEHDLKELMDSMTEPFTVAEVRPLHVYWGNLVRSLQEGVACDWGSDEQLEVSLNNMTRCLTPMLLCKPPILLNCFSKNPRGTSEIICAALALLSRKGCNRQPAGALAGSKLLADRRRRTIRGLMAHPFS